MAVRGHGPSSDITPQSPTHHKARNVLSQQLWVYMRLDSRVGLLITHLHVLAPVYRIQATLSLGMVEHVGDHTFLPTIQ